MPQIYKKIIFLFLVPQLLFGVGKIIYKEIEPEFAPPWLTGPLIAPSGQTIPKGHANAEPYIYVAAVPDVFSDHGALVPIPTFWSIISQTSIQVGVTTWMDVQVNPTFAWNYSQNAGKVVLNDCPIGIDVQIYEASNPTIPSVKLVLREVVPLGKYQNLNPDKHGTDAGGLGFWGTQLGVVMGQLVHFGGAHFLSYKIFFSYNFPTSVHLSGFNAHGGGFGTNARFLPSKSFTADVAFELTFSQNWAFALDLVGLWTTKTSYHGFAGTRITGAPARLGHGSWTQYSLAPAIEYNWSADLGLIAGAWFTFAGVRAPAFYNGVVALNYYH